MEQGSVDFVAQDYEIVLTSNIDNFRQQTLSDDCASRILWVAAGSN